MLMRGIPDAIYSNSEVRYSWNTGRNLASTKTRASAVAMQSRPGIDTPHIMYLLCGLRLAATAAVLRVVCYPGTPPSSLPDIRALDGQ